jgi:hypothetical protein
MIKYLQILFILFFVLNSGLHGQEKWDNSMDNCINLLNNGYVSDGQEYMANFNANNKAKFHTTFYGGNQYRIIACSDLKEYNLIINIFDTEKNLLYSNIKYNYIPFWNLAFTSTIECVIVLEVEAEKKIEKPVKLLIGFKKKETSNNP